MKLKVAVSQYDVPEAAAASFTKLDEVAAAAAAAQVKLLVVPETAVGMLADVKAAASDSLPGLKQIAKSHNIAIATSYYVSADGKFYNQGVIISGQGELIHNHRKLYLAVPERNTDGISAGSELTVSATDMGRLGMLICKDGFNKYSHYLYEALGQQQADITCIPVWSLGQPEMDTREYIKTIFSYGAFLSRSFILVSGNLNKSSGSFGGAMIISPVRGVLCEGSNDKEELLVRDIDLDEVASARSFDTGWQPINRLL